MSLSVTKSLRVFLTEQGVEMEAGRCGGVEASRQILKTSAEGVLMKRAHQEDHGNSSFTKVPYPRYWLISI